MSDSNDDRRPDADLVRKAAALRAARYSIGLSQVQMAEAVGLSKTPLARFETLVAPLKTEVFDAIVSVLEEQGVTIDISADHVDIHMNQVALDLMTDRLTSGKRRQHVERAMHDSPTGG